MLHANDLLSPKGRLTAAALWPGVSINEVTGTIEEYLVEGYTKTSADEAVRHWAYYRAFDQVYLTRLAMPSSASTSDEGSMSYTQAQIEELGRLAAEELEAFNDYIPAEIEAAIFGVIQSLR